MSRRPGGSSRRKFSVPLLVRRNDYFLLGLTRLQQALAGRGHETTQLGVVGNAPPGHADGGRELRTGPELVFQKTGVPAGYTRQPRYSQAHKERAVEHHRDHGHCIAATIKALGYPSRSLLSTWIQELNPQARAPAFGRPEELTPEAKQSAVIALCMRAASAQAVADDVGVSRGSLYKWKNQLLDHDATVPMKRQQDAPASSDRAELEQQLETLRRDVRRLQLEKDVLTKASELIKNRPSWRGPMARSHAASKRSLP